MTEGGGEISPDLMNYPALAQAALRGVIRQALERVVDEGLPGEHHFYITFKTRAPGVSIHADLLTKYPDEITVVIQHQYEDLLVSDDQFSVKLRFGGVPRPLVVPYAAITRFYDPSVQFILQFDEPDIPEPEDEPEPTAEAPPVGDDDGPKVVSLDQFRKK